MNVTFNLNYLLVFGLALCIIILIYMLIKHIFVPENPTNSQNISGNPNKKNLPTNIDFFNTSAKIIEKSNKIVDEKNNKVYQFIDLGDKIIIMEETLFIPQMESIKNEETVLNNNTLVFKEDDSFVPEQITSSIEKFIFENDAAEMKEIIAQSDEDYNQLHADLFTLAVADPEFISSTDDNDSFLI